MATYKDLNTYINEQELVTEVPEDASVLIATSAGIKRAPGNQLGGGGDVKTAVIYVEQVVS